MNQDIINAWDKHNSELRQYLSTTDQDEYQRYEILLKKTLEFLFPNDSTYDDNNYGMPDHERITQVNYGDYQGTLVFVIGGHGYQPSVEDHWYTSVSYGSCSGCDTLQGISCYESGLPTEEQVQDYWTLCLHMIQKMKRLGE